MQRTAEEFVHQVADGRWFVGDFVRTTESGYEVFLVEIARAARGVEIAKGAIASSARVRLYAQKRSAKREAQRMIERVLDAPDRVRDMR